MDELETLRWKVGVLRTILVALRQETHSYCEDSFYACPKNEDYCGPEERDVCTCGADVTNKLIDVALEETK